MAYKFSLQLVEIKPGEVDGTLQFGSLYGAFSVVGKSDDDVLALIYAAGASPDARKEGHFWCDNYYEFKEAIAGIKDRFLNFGAPDSDVAGMREQLGLEPADFNDYEVAWMEWRLRELAADEARSENRIWSKSKITIDVDAIAKRVLREVESRKHRFKIPV